jgi:hypothetical protein
VVLGPTCETSGERVYPPAICRCSESSAWRAGERPVAQGGRHGDRSAGRVPGVRLEQYDQINEGVGGLPGAPAAPQELFHFVVGTDEGIRVVDIWESEEAFQRYFRERLEPVFDEVGISAPPLIEIFPIHNYSIGSRLRS